MKLSWKLIAVEIVLEIILELAPASLSLMAAISEYLVELSLEKSRAVAQLVVSKDWAALHSSECMLYNRCNREYQMPSEVTYWYEMGRGA